MESELATPRRVWSKPIEEWIKINFGGAISKERGVAVWKFWRKITRVHVLVGSLSSFLELSNHCMLKHLQQGQQSNFKSARMVTYNLRRRQVGAYSSVTIEDQGMISNQPHPRRYCSFATGPTKCDILVYS
ncbi:hypothetical protein Salat_1317000 [Sesamum alatum]|uniref:Uncharacterized protein n=1 Tax=Sesamum alatum TaxID=300844 RepID=A0AAE1YHJ4_9LAMI|nr:hypothetical protein Salat_1317000 [Sesamum alatum]